MALFYIIDNFPPTLDNMANIMREKNEQAIQAALSGDWELAIELNAEILAESPNDLAALNRLARAYTEMGQKDEAKIMYQRVLAIDKYNPIATKNLKVLPHQKNGAAEAATVDEDFIEAPGLTKSIALVKVASRDILLALGCKQKLSLSPRTHLMSVVTEDKVYVGSLPDDLSLKLKTLLKRGYTYSACVKGTTDNTVSIFLRELKRPNRAGYSATFTRLSLK